MAAGLGGLAGARRGLTGSPGEDLPARATASSLRTAAPSLLRQRGAAIARASLAPGSHLAKQSSMPIAAIVARREDRPADTSGSGTPVIGSRPKTAQILTSAWTTIQAVAPAAASRMNGSVTLLATRSPA